MQTVTVSQARNIPDDTLVILTGNIIQSLGREKFIFRDSTGDIEIDRNLWLLLNLSVNANDRVEIRGEIDIENRVAEIDVKFFRKLIQIQKFLGAYNSLIFGKMFFITGN